MNPTRVAVRLFGERRAEWLVALAFLSFVRLRGRYVGSILGLGWSLLNPLTQIIVFSFVFSIVMRIGLDNYVIYLMSGLLPWTFIAASLSASAVAFAGRKFELNHSLVSPSLFAVSSIAIEFAAFVISYVVLLAVAALFFHVTPLALIYLPVALLPLILTTFSIGVICAYVGAIYADFTHILSIVLQLLFWMSPIVYHWSSVPEPFQSFIQYNPISLLISPAQIVLHGGQFPSLTLLLADAAIAAAACALAIRTHRSYARRIIYYL